MSRGASLERLRALRKKYGLGEFKKRGSGVARARSQAKPQRGRARVRARDTRVMFAHDSGTGRFAPVSGVPPGVFMARSLQGGVSLVARYQPVFHSSGPAVAVEPKE